VNLIISGTAIENIAVAPAKDFIVTEIAVNDVVSVFAMQLVMTAAAPNGILTRTAVGSGPINRLEAVLPA